MARVEITGEFRIPINQIDDMRRTLEWWHDLLPLTAREELAEEHAHGNLLDEVQIVDGRLNAPLDSVKSFGTIRFVGGLGPIEQAIEAADAVAHSLAPRDTGHYARSLQWFANGRPVGGPPSARQVGVKGNAELVDLAPYASMLEITVPRGVIYGAYNHVARMFSSTVSIGFRYANAKDFGGHMEKPGTRGGRFFKVPVLSIGNPVSTVTPGVLKSRPGANIRDRRGEARRALRKYLGSDR